MSAMIPAGTPLVFLNAFPLDRTQWDSLIGIVTQDNPGLGDIMTFDVPGIGSMPIVDEEPSLEIIADAAVAAMREVTGQRAAVWVGCSMGGYVAMAIAERDADAVLGLGLLGTKSTADDADAVARRHALAEAAEAHGGAPDPRAMAEALVGIQGPQREQVVADVAHNIGLHAGEGIAWGQRAMSTRPDRTEVLRGLDVPAVVVRGSEDSVVSAQDAQALAAALETPAVELEGIGHLAALEAPHSVAEALQPLMDKVT